MERKPDFSDLKNTLFCRTSETVHQIELMVDREVKEAFLGKPIESIAEEIEFWCGAGYEYVPLVTSVFGFMGNGGDLEITQEQVFRYSKYDPLPQKRKWAKEGKGVITTVREFDSFPWPDPEEIDLSAYLEAKKNVPDGIGIIGVVPRIFVAVWMLMGYEQFSLALMDQPELVEAIFAKVGETQLRIGHRLLRDADVDALWLGDDIACGHGLMAPPSVLRRLLFPWYKTMGDYCKKAGVPFIYHTDGNAMQVMHDLIDCGINALHPIEPGAMDAVDLRKKFGKSLCLLGNIELDTLCRGSIGDIEKLTISRLEKLWNNGGYCPGSSNSISNFVPLDNYRAMLRSIRKFSETHENKRLDK